MAGIGKNRLDIGERKSQSIEQSKASCAVADIRRLNSARDRKVFADARDRSQDNAHSDLWYRRLANYWRPYHHPMTMWRKSRSIPVCRVHAAMGK